MLGSNCVGVKTIPRTLDKNTTVLTCIGQLNFTKNVSSIKLEDNIKDLWRIPDGVPLSVGLGVD